LAWIQARDHVLCLGSERSRICRATRVEGIWKAWGQFEHLPILSLSIRVELTFCLTAWPTEDDHSGRSRARETGSVRLIVRPMTALIASHIHLCYCIDLLLSSTLFTLAFRPLHLLLLPSLHSLHPFQLSCIRLSVFSFASSSCASRAAIHTRFHDRLSGRCQGLWYPIIHLAKPNDRNPPCDVPLVSMAICAR
jgi:hypothetical protein